MQLIIKTDKDSHFLQGKFVLCVDEEKTDTTITAVNWDFIK